MFIITGETSFPEIDVDLDKLLKSACLELNVQALKGIL